MFHPIIRFFYPLKRGAERDCSASLRGAFFATKQSLSKTEIASQSALAMTNRLNIAERQKELSAFLSEDQRHQRSKV